MIQIDIPEGVKVAVQDGAVSVTGPLGTNRRTINDRMLNVTADGKSIKVDSVKIFKKLLKKTANCENSFAKELKNDMAGVSKHYEIKMKVVFAHFPISIEVKSNEVRINNMIGERAARISRIVGSTKVEVKGQDMRLYGTSKDDVTQTAANLRKAVKIRKKDERTFQDGVYYSID